MGILLFHLIHNGLGENTEIWIFQYDFYGIIKLTTQNHQI